VISPVEGTCAGEQKELEKTTAAGTEWVYQVLPKKLSSNIMWGTIWIYGTLLYDINKPQGPTRVSARLHQAISSLPSTWLTSGVSKLCLRA